ncbi:MAG: ABC transporter permease, partial [Bacteroidota bacterium]
MNKNIEYTIEPPSKFSLNLQELWIYRELFYFFTWRDIKVKYKQTVLGFLWAVLQPFLMMMVFVVFFSKALNVPTDNIPAPIFYYSGLLLWNIFSTGLAGAGNSMVTNANIIKKIYFPRLIIPMSSILVAFFDFLMALIVFGGILLFYEWTMPTFYVNYLRLVLYLPLALIMTILGTFGIGSFLAALNVKYRDFRYVIPFMIQFLLFITPVIYPVSIFKDISWIKYVLAINPMTGA